MKVFLTEYKEGDKTFAGERVIEENYMDALITLANKGLTDHVIIGTLEEEVFELNLN